MIESFFNAKEPLHPDLADSLCEIDGFGAAIKHPLVFSVPHFDGLNAYVNRQYEQKVKAVGQAIAKQDWGAYLALHERPYRFFALSSIADQIGDDAEFWKLFGWCWTDSENIWQNWTIVSPMLRSGRPGREHIMDDEEKAALAALPDVVTVYRGHKRHNRNGLSWTLDRDKAVWFATRFRKRGAWVSTGMVRRKNVIALLLGRNENEVICFPEDVLKRTQSKP